MVPELTLSTSGLQLPSVLYVEHMSTDIMSDALTCGQCVSVLRGLMTGVVRWAGRRSREEEQGGASRRSRSEKKQPPCSTHPAR